MKKNTLKNVKLNKDFLQNCALDTKTIQEARQNYTKVITEKIAVAADELARSVNFLNWEDLKSKPEYGFVIYIEQPNNGTGLTDTFEVKLTKIIKTERLEFSVFNSNFPEIKIDINNL